MLQKLKCAVDTIKPVKPAELKAILDSDKAGEYLLVDVRQPEEYRAGHIPGAILIPMGELEARQAELEGKRKVITYCRAGHRSLAAAVTLCGLGFSEPRHLEGGILNWKYETVTGIPEPTSKVLPKVARPRDILLLGIRLEKGAQDFYRTAQQNPKLLKAKKLLQMLENVEGKHLQQLYSRLVALAGEASPPTLNQLLKDTKGVYMEGGLEVSKALLEVTEKVTSEVDMLDIGIEKEYLASDFYRRAATLVVDADSKSLLHELAQAERTHASLLLNRLAEVVRQPAAEEATP